MTAQQPKHRSYYNVCQQGKKRRTTLSADLADTEFLMRTSGADFTSLYHSNPGVLGDPSGLLTPAPVR